MTGFWIAEMPRDVVSMNMFSQISAVHRVADTIRPCGDRSVPSACPRWKGTEL